MPQFSQKSQNSIFFLLERFSKKSQKVRFSEIGPESLAKSATPSRAHVSRINRQTCGGFSPIFVTQVLHNHHNFIEEPGPNPLKIRGASLAGIQVRTSGKQLSRQLFSTLLNEVRENVQISEEGRKFLKHHDANHKIAKNKSMKGITKIFLKPSQS